MIVTCKKKIPFSWIVTTVTPWSGIVFQNGVMGVAFLFSMKKFVENPAGITFVLSLPSLVSLVLAPVVSFMSDRVWTKFGRRKPFVTMAWLGTGASLLVMPLMPNFWALLGAFVVYSACNDFSSPAEALLQEVVAMSHILINVVAILLMLPLGLLIEKWTYFLVPRGGSLTGGNRQDARALVARREELARWFDELQMGHHTRMSTSATPKPLDSSIYLDFLNAFRRINSHLTSIA